MSVGAPMVQALPRGKAAMFLRSTLGFGHLGAFGRPQPRIGGLSVAKTQRIRKASRSVEPRGPGRRNGHKSVQLEHKDRYIYHVFTRQ